MACHAEGEGVSLYLRNLNTVIDLKKVCKNKDWVQGVGPDCWGVADHLKNWIKFDIKPWKHKIIDLLFTFL